MKKLVDILSEIQISSTKNLINKVEELGNELKNSKDKNIYHNFIDLMIKYRYFQIDNHYPWPDWIIYLSNTQLLSLYKELLELKKNARS